MNVVIKIGLSLPAREGVPVVFPFHAFFLWLCDLVACLSAIPLSPSIMHRFSILYSPPFNRGAQPRKRSRSLPLKQCCRLSSAPSLVRSSSAAAFFILTIHTSAFRHGVKARALSDRISSLMRIQRSGSSSFSRCKNVRVAGMLKALTLILLRGKY